MKALSKDELELITRATLSKTAEIGFKHAELNMPYVKKNINQLKKELDGNYPVNTVIVSGGPSLHKNKSIEAIKKYKDKLCIVAVDGTMGHCLRNGLVPDYVLTVDPHPSRIIRWFGDPKLDKRNEDDYFQRQDLDPALNTDEVKRNHELIELVNKYGSEMKLIISTSISPEITERSLEAGMDLYWWNPLYDDVNSPDSISKKIYRYNKVPCMVTGGNVGTSAWVFSHAILKSKNVILVGMDLSYAPGTNVLNTQYYEHIKELFENPEDGLIEIFNPYLNETWLTDPAYYWYSEGFKDMAKNADCVTYNCTEGGIVFGDNIHFLKLSECFDKLNL